MDVVRKRLIAIQRGKEVVTVLAYIVREKDSLIEKYENCVITGLSFDTSPDGGYAIYPNISIEQVNVVKVKVTQAEADKITPTTVAGQGTGIAGKGNVAGTKGTVSTEERESNAGYEYWVDKSQEAQATNAQLRQDIEAKRKRNATQ